MSHDAFMRCALDLVTQLPSLISPNPRVGCVIVRDGHIIGQGSTRPPGGNHAEIEALNDAARRGQDVRGATLYVTLEPCAHHGRTPPCVDALITAGIARVVFAMRDPDPRVSGGGMARLQSAGIDVVCGVLEDDARDMNRGFLSRLEKGRPWVRLKIAASLDGITVLPNGESQWITSVEAREDGHRWRARADAILTGIGTVMKDDPQLTVRGVDVPAQPRRILVDSRLSVDPAAQILSDGKAWVFSASPDFRKVALLQERGIEVVTLPDANWRIDLPAMMRELAKREINEVHVEAGAVLNGALLRADCADELLIYMAPSLLGDGRGLFSLPAPDNPGEGITLAFDEISRVGTDLRVIARVGRQSEKQVPPA
ncbi:MAG: bifunctional diaminohydroxyphosphoribosylaminopyrimidine deaminase/5-amino-6-(5-phosphoribosylamino)uracil reductase RibD [Burkholderiaceae bacterium]|jgi:diaminohydroxyphosphoribosylaminopyrimidine deaminase/5-amino-6-(5-phosphoribosylamino)uracil reductase|nr:bifunctional diaminohydroxyphosphoribosylaminopyrimidine deaminase/5-amino-6-(5-phosphoribosylamino)uracil reductase RibD [Burkholderiaceae bacterium]